MFLAHIHIFLEHLRAFRCVVASNDLAPSPYGEGDGRTFWQICVPNDPNFQHICPTFPFAHKAWIYPIETGDKPIIDRSIYKRLACHPKGDVTSNWIALRYAYASFSLGGSGRWQPKNLFTLVLLPKLEGGETEEDVT